ncbi:MAG: Lrp/AsnC family transcriptional regulator [Euryarchaeota archaeon]|nr:Lrp/AsnC family transcriptional regulator [Euryarchaeota archaeon]
MDITNLRILKRLKENSRESLGNIAKELGISKATVSRRVSRMEKEGYISDYSLVIDPSRLGLMKAMVSLQVMGTAVNSVIEELKKFPQIESVTRVFGDHSLVCHIYATSVDSLYELIQGQLLKIPNIHNVEVDIVIDSVDINRNAELDLAKPKLLDNL